MNGGARVLVTGASGFVGAYLVRCLVAQGFAVRGASRSPTPIFGAEAVLLPDLARDFDAGPLVANIDAVVHLAGIAHATSAIPDAIYHAVNAEASRKLAVAAGEARVRQFILMSSVRAQSGPCAGAVLTEAMDPAPTDAYGRSKLEAERAIAAALEGTHTASVALRPVLIYGPGVKGNMGVLERLARSRLPLPLGGLSAKRSLLSLENLAGAVEYCLRATPIVHGTYLVADANPVSVAEIIANLRAGLGRKPGLVAMPSHPIQMLLRRAGRANAADRLFGNLIVDTAALRLTGWSPQHNTAHALAAWMRDSPDRSWIA